jgi:hypothetical protein
VRKYLLAAAFLAVLSSLLILAFRWSTPVDTEVPPLPAAVAQAEVHPAAAVEIAGVCTDLYHAICGRSGETRDPTGVVRPDIDAEKLTSQLADNITHAHPDWVGSQVDEELVKQIYTPRKTQRLQGAFQWAARALESFINRQPDSVFNASEKRKLKARLKSVQLQLPPPAAVYDDEPDLYTKTDVFYERTLDGKLRMRIGGAYLVAAKSWFNMLFTVAHELAHSVDPCEVRAAGLAFPAYDRLAACFLRDGLIEARSTRRECGQNDQLSESFADWMAVQVTAEALESFATRFHGPALVAAATNSVRDLCEEEGDVSDSQYHPEPRIRIDRIFGQNPKIRSLLGCSPLAAHLPQYCGFGAFSPPAHPGMKAGPMLSGETNAR